MKRRLGFFVVFATLAFAGFAQETRQDDIKTLIASLGSSNYKVREDAARKLRERPEAEAAMRAAMRSLDLEAQRRASDILDHFDSRCVRKLHGAVEAGRIDLFLESLGTWPNGKYEGEIWRATQSVMSALARKHKKLGGVWERADGRKSTRLDRMTRATKIPTNSAAWAKSVDLRFASAPEEQHDVAIERGSHVILSAGSVHANGRHVEKSVILARGDVEISIIKDESGTEDVPAELYSTLIISAGSVKAFGFRNCLIIARGPVSCGYAVRSRIISGKKVTLESTDPAWSSDNIISENEPTPLGFIRWSDSPKDKAAAKAK